MNIKPANGGVVVQLGAKEAGLPGASASPFRIQRILMPVDFSDCSRKALRYAIPFAQQFGASLTLLFVTQINYAVGEFGLVDSPLLEGQAREAAEEAMDKLLAEEIGGIVPATKQTRIGRPASEIAAAAKELDADLIIISTHGHTGLKHVFLGSVTENVARVAPCPCSWCAKRSTSSCAPEPPLPPHDLCGNIRRPADRPP